MMRNSELYRPYWDFSSVDDRYRTISQIQQTVVKQGCSGENKPGMKRTESRKARSNISPLFSYPKSSAIESTSKTADSFETLSAVALNRPIADFKLKRNAYSEYNERRIRFGLKF